MTKFMMDLEIRGLRLSDSDQEFYNLLCEATCAIYRANNKKSVRMVRRVRNPPRGWTQDLETIWMDHLETQLFSSTYWYSFWHTIDEALWEIPLPAWRPYLQFVLLNSIQRDLCLLEDEGFISQNTDGEFVPVEENDEPVMAADD